MEYLKKWTGNVLLSVLILAASFGISLMIQTIFSHGYTDSYEFLFWRFFLTAMTVDGYVIPILASLVSVCLQLHSPLHFHILHLT